MKNKIAIFTIAAIILVAISLNVVIFIAVPSILLDTPTFKVVWIFAFPVNVLMAIIATYFAFRESVDDIIRIPPIMYLVYTFATIYFTLGMKFMYTPFKSYKIPLATGIIVTTVYIIVFVFLLQLLHSAGEAAHPHHAALALELEGQQDQLEDHGKQNDSDTIGLGHGVEQSDQPGKGNANQISDARKHSSFLRM